MMNYCIIGGYLLVSVLVGIVAARRNENTESYLLGSRRMPFLAVGLSAMMTLCSSVSLVNMPGEVYNNGITLFFLGLIVMPVMQIVAYMLFVRFYFKLGSFTPYEYLEYRYNSSVRALIALCAFYERMIYLGMVLYATSRIFLAAYGWPPYFTILLACGVGLTYTVWGGMKAVIWTDVLQFCFFVIGIGLLLYNLFGSIHGGFFTAIQTALDAGHGIPQFTEASFYSISPYVRLLFILLLWDMIMAPIQVACSDQIHLQRLLSTRNWKEGLKSQLVCTVISWCSRVILILIGLGLYTYYRQNPDPALAKLGGDGALFRFISTQLPDPVPALFIAAMLAAIMSTLSSGLNSMATVYLKEIHAKFINRNMDDAKEMQVSRHATFWIGVFAMVLGILINISGEWFSQSMAEVGVLFGLLGAATVPAFLLAVLTRRANVAMIWGYTFLTTGSYLGGSWWYAVSRPAEQAWLANPTLPFGGADKISQVCWIVPVVCGLAMCAPWLVKTLRKTTGAKALALLGLIWLGVAISTVQWYLFSNICIDDVPLARSFAFNLPVTFIGAFIVIWFCPVQPEEKYKGLTIATLGEPIAALAGKQGKQ